MAWHSSGKSKPADEEAGEGGGQTTNIMAKDGVLCTTFNLDRRWEGLVDGLGVGLLVVWWKTVGPPGDSHTCL